MKYFTKEWYAACDVMGYRLDLQVSKHAEAFSEEYYHDLYLRRRRAFVKESKEEAEKNKVPFDKAAAEAEFQICHENTVKAMEERLPKEILEQVADIRVLALNITTKEVRQQLKELFERNEKQMRAVQKECWEEYWKEYCPKVKEAVGEEIQKAFNFHDSIITAVEMKEHELAFKMEPCFSNVKKVIFKNYKILEQDGYLLGASWLYQEVHPAEGGNEYHGLLWKENGETGYLTIFAEEIVLIR